LIDDFETDEIANNPNEDEFESAKVKAPNSNEDEHNIKDNEMIAETNEDESIKVVYKKKAK
jgi:hypothetical protein